VCRCVAPYQYQLTAFCWSAVNHLTCCQRVLALLFLVVGLKYKITTWRRWRQQLKPQQLLALRDSLLARLTIAAVIFVCVECSLSPWINFIN
jgi:hypothetical protein